MLMRETEREREDREKLRKDERRKMSKCSIGEGEREKLGEVRK